MKTTRRVNINKIYCKNKKNYKKTNIYIQVKKICIFIEI
jgi:hypothetical protein